MQERLALQDLHSGFVHFLTHIIARHSIHTHIYPLPNSNQKHNPH
jgi:hypothetical protein